MSAESPIAHLKFSINSPFQWAYLRVNKRLFARKLVGGAQIFGGCPVITPCQIKTRLFPECHKSASRTQVEFTASPARNGSQPSIVTKLVVLAFESAKTKISLADAVGREEQVWNLLSTSLSASVRISDDQG